MNEEGPEAFPGIAVDAEAGERDLFRLVLTVVDLSRQLMEKQVSRDETSELTEDQREALALALERLEEAMEGFRRHYGLPISDLEIDLDNLAPRVREGGPRKAELMESSLIRHSWGPHPALTASLLEKPLREEKAMNTNVLQIGTLSLAGMVTTALFVVPMVGDNIAEKAVKRDDDTSAVVLASGDDDNDDADDRFGARTGGTNLDNTAGTNTGTTPRRHHRPRHGHRDRRRRSRQLRARQRRPRQLRPQRPLRPRGCRQLRAQRRRQSEAGDDSGARAATTRAATTPAATTRRRRKLRPGLTPTREFAGLIHPPVRTFDRPPKQADRFEWVSPVPRPTSAHGRADRRTTEVDHEQQPRQLAPRRGRPAHPRADRDAVAGWWLVVRGLPGLRRGHLLPRGGEGDPARPGRGRVQSPRAAPRGGGTGCGQPPGRGPRPAPRARGRAAPRRPRAHRRPPAVVPDPAARAAAGAAVPAARDRCRRGAALPPSRRLRAPGHQAQQHHHGSTGAAHRPVRRPSRRERRQS